MERVRGGGAADHAGAAGRCERWTRGAGDDAQKTRARTAARNVNTGRVFHRAHVSGGTSPRAGHDGRGGGDEPVARDHRHRRAWCGRGRGDALRALEQRRSPRLDISAAPKPKPRHENLNAFWRCGTHTARRAPPTVTRRECPPPPRAPPRRRRSDDASRIALASRVRPAHPPGRRRTAMRPSHPPVRGADVRARLWCSGEGCFGILSTDRRGPSRSRRTSTSSEWRSTTGSTPNAAANGAPGETQGHRHPHRWMVHQSTTTTSRTRA